ncbi:RNA-binding protein [Desulfolucanica intricata]|uniref:RNA-binding protein n=1 Tax=Desulfolucanica intricata TaxID=1285191 RepID=UPI000A7AEA98|nr:RNA-binding protein [Desulfolucanica intricata]
MFKIAPEGYNLREFDLWSDLYDAKERGTLVDALIVRVRRISGQGEIWELEFPDKPGITGLVPVSQSGLPEKSPMNEFVGQRVTVKIKSIDRENDLVACSRQEAVDIALNKIISKLEENEVINAVVRVVTRHNLFLDIGGGVIVRINQGKARLSDGVPLEVQYEVGTIVKVKVTGINREEKCIEVEPVDPWEIWEYNRGEVLIGRVAAIREPFAFISIKPGIIGRTAYKNTDKYKVGDIEEFQVVSFNRAKRHLHLIKWDTRRVNERRRERAKSKTKRATIGNEG